MKLSILLFLLFSAGHSLAGTLACRGSELGEKGKVLINDSVDTTDFRHFTLNDSSHEYRLSVTLNEINGDHIRYISFNRVENGIGGFSIEREYQKKSAEVGFFIQDRAFMASCRLSP